jgi:hypothetical protein
MIKGGVSVKGISETVHGHNVIGYMSGQYYGDLSFTDSSTLESWYRRDPMSAHLGIVNAVSAHKTVAFPLLATMLTNAGHITVDGTNGKFTYDIAVETSHGTYTTIDFSSQQNCGIDNSIFKIGLNSKFRPGDVLTYDAQGGHNVVVSAEYPVRQEGSDFVHTVRYQGQSKKSWFPSDKLRPGIHYWKVGNLLGEYSTQYSGISAINPVDLVRCEFVLGNHRGVEASATMYGGEHYLRNLTKGSSDFIKRAQEEIKGWGVLPDGNKVEKVFFGRRVQDPKSGKWKMDMNNTIVMDVIAYLALAELLKIEELGLMFQRGGVLEDNNSVIRANEGLWYQLWRGYTIGYSRPGGLMLTHLRQAGEYIYRDSQSIPLEDRYLRFKCGKMAYENAMKLVQNEFNQQIQTLAPLMGSDRVLPNNPVSGSLDALTLKLVRAKTCFLPGIGYAEFQHEPSLDMMPMTDNQSRGFYGNNMPWSSYCMYIEDVTSRESSNAYVSKPALDNDVRIVKKGTNLYYITPEQGGLYCGFQQGRWSTTDTTQILASHPGMDTTFFCHSRSALWMSDPSRVLLIHLNRAA